MSIANELLPFQEKKSEFENALRKSVLPILIDLYRSTHYTGKSIHAVANSHNFSSEMLVNALSNRFNFKHKTDYRTNNHMILIEGSKQYLFADCAEFTYATVGVTSEMLEDAKNTVGVLNRINELIVCSLRKNVKLLRPDDIVDVLERTDQYHPYYAPYKWMADILSDKRTELAHKAAAKMEDASIPKTVTLFGDPNMLSGAWAAAARREMVLELRQWEQASRIDAEKEVILKGMMAHRPVTACWPSPIATMLFKGLTGALSPRGAGLPKVSGQLKQVNGTMMTLNWLRSRGLLYWDGKGLRTTKFGMAVLDAWGEKYPSFKPMVAALAPPKARKKALTHMGMVALGITNNDPFKEA